MEEAERDEAVVVGDPALVDLLEDVAGVVAVGHVVDPVHPVRRPA